MKLSVSESPQRTDPIVRLVELNRHSANVPEGLRAAAEECFSKRERRALLRLADKVESGGDPLNFQSTELESLVAAAAVENLSSDEELLTGPELAQGTDLASDPVSIAPRLASWIERDRELRTAIRQIETHLWIAVSLLCLGGLANWVLVQLVHGAMMEIFREYELDIDPATITFFHLVSWIGPVVVGISACCAVVLLMYRFGPMRETIERGVYSLPYLGTALRRLHLSLMCEHLARLLAAGYTYPAALRTASTLSGSITLKQWSSLASRAVEEGGSLIDALDYLPVRGEILPAVVGPVGPSPNSPWVGWGFAANYFRLSGVRGAANARFVIPVFSIIATVLGWLGMTGIFAPIISLISSLGGY